MLLTSSKSVLAIALFSLINPLNVLAITPGLAQSVVGGKLPEQQSTAVASVITGLTLPFIANAGQIDPLVAFYTHTFSGTVYVTQAGEVVYALPARDGKLGWTLVERFYQGKAHPHGIEPSSSKVNYIKNQAGKAVSQESQTFGNLNLGEVFTGVEVSLVAHGNNVEKVYTIAPGADANNIQMEVSGANTLKVDAQGALLAETGLGSVQFSAPIAWQEQQGKKTPVSASYTLTKNGYGFKLGEYDHSKPVMIDPLIQATYLGGNGTESAIDIAVHPISGDVYVLGETQSPGAGFPNSFPGTTGGWNSIVPPNSNYNLFLSRLTADLKTLVQTTYLFPMDESSLLIHPKSGDVYLLGHAFPYDIPNLVGGAIPQGNITFLGSTIRAYFFSQLTADLTQLKQSSLLQNTSKYNNNKDNDIGLSSMPKAKIHPVNGNIYLAGTNDSANTKIERPIILKIPSDLKPPLNFTQITDSKQNAYGNDIDIHPVTGDVYMAGETTFNDFPQTAGGYQPNNNSIPSIGMKSDGFIAQFSADLNTLKQATYLGGTQLDSIGGISFDSSGNSLYVGGITQSSDFPGLAGGAVSKPTTTGTSSVYFAKMTSDLKNLRQSTMLFSGGGTIGFAWYAHPTITDALYLIGDFTIDSSSGQPAAMRFSNDLKTFNGGKILIDSTLKHPGLAYAQSSLTGDLYIVGNQGTTNTSFPQTTGGYQPTPATTSGGKSDIYIARYSLSDVGSLVAKADVGITVSSSPNPATAGTALSYTLRITNNGPDAVSQVKVTDNLPSSVNFVSASSGCSQSVQTITCNVGSLASGAQAAFTITVLPTQAGALSNTASVVAAETDPQPNNNSATQTITVLSAGVVEKADLAITQTVNAASVQVDGDLQYTIKVQNNGPDNASSVAITDEFPASANINSAAGCSISNTVVNCLVGNLAVGASKSYTVSVSPSEEGSFSSTATVTGGETDNNQANNSVTKTVSVTNSVVPALANADVGLGDKVTITGEGFSNKKGSVKIGGKTASIVSWTDGVIVVKLPTLKAGVYAAKVINKNKMVVDLGQLTVHAPEIGALSIGSAAKNTKIQFTVTGQYFGNGVKPAVYLVSSKNKRTAVTVSKGYSNSALTIVTPKLQADTYQVLVTNSVGNSQLLALVVN